MLHLLDESFEEFLRAVVPLAKDAVDVSFDAPDRDLRAKVGTRPMVDIYLWDVRRNLAERDAGLELVQGEDGALVRRAPLPRVDCRYLITAWTTDVQDEHSLLGDVLVALLRHPQIEPPHLRGAYSTIRPLPTLEVAMRESEGSADFWSALGGQLKPGLDVVVTATLDAARPEAAGPPTEAFELTTTDGVARSSRRFSAGRAPGAAGSLVVSAHGSATVREDGTYLLPGDAGDDKHLIDEVGAVELADDSPDRRSSHSRRNPRT